MAKAFRPNDPDQMHLHPPSRPGWLPEGHLARCVGDVVASLNLLARLDSTSQALVLLLDARTLQEWARIELPGREAEGGTWVSLSADGSRLAAGTASGRALIWDLAELRSELRARGLDP